MNKKQRAALAAKTNGRCGYCGCELPQRWHADHMKPIIRKIIGEDERGACIYGKESWRPELDMMDNMIASCPSCNIRKGANSVEGFRADIEGRIEAMNKLGGYKLALRFGQVAETPKPVVFYFETLEVKNEV